jgi:hypothetical protein
MLDTPPRSSSASDEPDRTTPSETGVRRYSGRRPTLRAADPTNPTRRDTAPAGTVFAVMLTTLTLAALINAETMVQRAEGDELGLGRDLALAFWHPVEELGSSMGLTLPRRGLDGLREADRTGSLVPKTVTEGDAPPDGSLDRSSVAGPALDQVPATGAPTGTTDGSPTTGGESPMGPTTSDTTTAGPAIPTIGDTAPTSGPALDPSDPVAAEGPAPPGEASEGDTAQSGPPAPSVDTGAFTLRRPTPADPLRVLIIGDSTLDAVGSSVLRDLGATGVTDGVLDYRVSTGLSRPDFFDWPAHLRRVRPQLDPEIVVIMLGANDAQPFVIGSDVEEFATERWLETYRARVASLLDELTAEGDWVVWIGQPVMRRDDFDARMQILNQVYAEQAARYPTVVYIDSRSILSDGSGAYAAYLPDASGSRTLVRRSDGIHLTPEGGDLLSPTVIAAINEIAPLF